MTDGVDVSASLRSAQHDIVGTRHPERRTKSEVEGTKMFRLRYAPLNMTVGE